jgi:hypothetical protein
MNDEEDDEEDEDEESRNSKKKKKKKRGRRRSSCRKNMSSGVLRRGISLSQLSCGSLNLSRHRSASFSRNYTGFLPASSKDEVSDAWLSDYEAFRRSLCGGSLNYKALFVDAAGTLIVPAQPAAKVFWGKASIFPVSSFRVS